MMARLPMAAGLVNDFGSTTGCTFSVGIMNIE
jgi:hypothetical protein